MKAILVDDELHNLENLSRIIRNHFPEISIAGTARSVKEAAILIQERQPDLVFLDIQMGKESGFDLLKKISERNFEVVFVTAFDQYGIQAIKFAALDYILKPIDVADLEIAIKRATEKVAQKSNHHQLDFLMNYIRRGERQPNKIALPQYNEIRYVAVKDIIRCEAQNTYVYFYLKGESRILISRPLKEYDDLLSPQGFIRCHQTHLINPAYIKSLLKEDGGSLLLLDGTKVPVSKAKKEFVKQALNK